MGVNINFGKLMQQTVKKFANRVALVNIERKRSFTFMELHLLTNKICNMLRTRFGMGEGDVYFNILENDNFSLIHFWLFKGQFAGAWTNYRDSFDEHMWQIDLVKPKLVFLENSLLQKYYSPLRQRGIEIVCMDPLEERKEGIHLLWDLIEGVTDEETGIEYDREEHIVLYRFTGGTTGKGKCAVYNLDNIILPMYGFYDHIEMLIDSETRHLHLTPVSHASAAFVFPLFFKGATSVTMNLPDLKQFCLNIQSERISSTLLVPTILYRFLEFEVEKMFDLSSLRNVFYGASPMTPDKLLSLQDKFGCIFIQAYGATEALPPVSLLGKAEHKPANHLEQKRLGSCGRPASGYEIGIFDENGSEIPHGTTGEIWIRGPGVIKGYFKNPGQTESEFTDTGWWKSGDLGYVDEDGYIYIVDRKKDMIITGGFNVYAIEIEEVLASHPAVLMSAVVGVPHPDWGEAVHAEVVLAKDSAVTEEELIAHCKERKGNYKAPKSIVFVDSLPVTPVGKILRRAVRDKYWQSRKRQVQ